MALIAPFKGVLYNPKWASDLSQLVAPPYDVISPQQQSAYYTQHPYNIIRLDYGLTFPSDTPEDNRYTRAAHILRIWQEKKIFVQDEQPAIYLYKIHYRVTGEEIQVRTGFISLLGLEPFETGQVRPHEKTFSAHKQDRYHLLEQTQMHFCPIFSFYLDPENAVLSLLSTRADHEPFMDFYDPDSIRHQIWRVTDPSTLKEVRHIFKDKNVFIADGHHRYETGLAYQGAMKKKYPRWRASSPFNFTLMFLCNMTDPGLTIFPVHRAFKKAVALDRDQFEKMVSEDFMIEKIPFTVETKSQSIQDLLSRLKQKGGEAPTFGLIRSSSPCFYLLTLKKESLEGPWGQDLHPLLRELDVLILSRFIIQKALGLSREELDHENIIEYCKDVQQALKLVESGKCEMSFLLNPTPIEQVRRIAEASLVMPRKSTYFYPKTLTGLVMNLLDPHDSIRID